MAQDGIATVRCATAEEDPAGLRDHWLEQPTRTSTNRFSSKVKETCPRKIQAALRDHLRHHRHLCRSPTMPRPRRSSNRNHAPSPVVVMSLGRPHSLGSDVRGVIFGPSSALRDPCVLRPRSAERHTLAFIIWVRTTLVRTLVLRQAGRGSGRSDREWNARNAPSWHAVASPRRAQGISAGGV